MVDARRVLILVKDKNGAWEDATARIADYHPVGPRFEVRFTGSQQAYTYGAAKLAVLAEPIPIPIPAGSRVQVAGAIWRQATELWDFHGPAGVWRRVFYRTRNGEHYRTYLAEKVRLLTDAANSPQAASIMQYWRQIVLSRPNDDPIVIAYRSLDFIDPDSALARYLEATRSADGRNIDPVVFPFACNLSQHDAVRHGLNQPVSVIEGPPGTGKTETILNLLANIVTQELGSVAVVSFSNAAVDNVREKLADGGFGHIVASLGNSDIRSTFFGTQSERNVRVDEFVRRAPADPPLDQLAALGQRLRGLQENERRRAELRAKVDSYELERRHFEHHVRKHGVPELAELPLQRKSSERILSFLAETQMDQETGHPGLLRRVRRYFRYGSLRGLDPGDTETVLRLQERFYHQRIRELGQQIDLVERELAQADFEGLRSQLQASSANAFAAALAARYRQSNRTHYSATDYRTSTTFPKFLQDYPVILSTCHSLRNSIPDGYLLDYLIIDEASQVDLLSASLALASCRNLIVVGDRRQLPQISGAVPDGLEVVEPYDYQRHSILSSHIQLYGEALPRTLLREHYRCHPSIIGFCNSAFYDGELIPYTSARDRDAPAMAVQPTARGNHMREHRGRGRSNQREIDVILREVLPKVGPGIEEKDIAIAAPYRMQADKATEQLNALIDVDTVHKLQGRQKKVVVMTTVLSETWQGRAGLKFVDDPHLVNVAVSRAVDQFILVTNFDKLPNSRYLRDLIGYIEYLNPEDEPPTSTVTSVFDLLYREYSELLAPLAARLCPEAIQRSEEIIRVVLGDILSEPGYGHLRSESQILLRNLVADPSMLTEQQRSFLEHRASLDFVVYNRITRRPFLAVEVDGFQFHENNPVQLERDALKDTIFEDIGMPPPLRLPTTGSNEEQRIREALSRAEAHWAQLDVTRSAPADHT